MNNFNLQKISEELIDTFMKAGEIAKEISLKGVKITIKSDRSPVTDGDIEVDKVLRNKIQSLTPKIPIISEETTNLEPNEIGKTFWLIDPIDGTRDYIKKRDEYTLNAALIIDFNPALGIVYAPAKKRMFFSYGTNLAFEIKSGERKKLNCGKIKNSEIIGLENSSNTPKEVLDIYKKYEVSKMVRMTSSLKFCVLAAGEADIYAAKPRAFEWDIAAGHAILEHAGGSVTTFEGQKFLYGKNGYKNLAIVAKRAADLKK